jgi:hypothetical protein
MNTSTELDPMASLPNELDDLDNLFEFGDIDLNNIPDADGYADHMSQQHPGTHPNTPYQDLSQAPSMPGTSAHDFGGQSQYALAQSMSHPRQHITGHNVPATMPYTTEGIYQPSIQQMYNHQQNNYPMHSQHAFPPHHQMVVPPTPNSLDMYGMAGQFMQQPDAQQRAIMEQRYGMRKDNIAFTPMVSPAGTPQFNMLPEFTTPGAYFSPLTSPMLHAQNQQHLHQQQQGYLTNPSTAPSSNTNSPVDPNLDVDMGDLPPVEPQGPPPRKSGRRKVATAKRAGTTSSKGSQSTSKAQKRKSSSQLQTPDSHVRSAPPSTSHTQLLPESSEADSISPEPLSESVMGPPPRPGSSVTQSPALAGAQQPPNAAAVASAATPKSLLTMRHQQPINGKSDSPLDHTLQNQDVGGLDDLALPEAATKQHSGRPSLNQINTQIAASAVDEDTPRLSARKTPKLGPTSTPSSIRPGSAMQTPVIGSPMTASTPSAILGYKKDGKGGRGSKKRGSMSANGSKMVSPTLVPKISPSIKPLLPEGSTCPRNHVDMKFTDKCTAPLNTATQAMLLASKSNYQNLLEGNRLPGVNYPDSLSTGLTSKRTSHKVAEQGRRNRINEALKEMQSLIPKPLAKSPSNGGPVATPADGDASPEAGEDGNVGDDALTGKESKEEAAAKSNSSKAATVELANEYIKRMQKDYANQSAKIEQLEREKEELVKRLTGQSPSEASVDAT